MTAQLPPDSDYATIAQLVQPPHIPAQREKDPAIRNIYKRQDPNLFGSRYLEEGDDVFEFNAWDHVETDPDYRAYAEQQFAKQRESPVSDFDRKRFNGEPAKWWDKFYKSNQANFFKDRKWLFKEFPLLEEVTRKEAGRKVLLEVGAGAGNTAFPLLANNENDELMIHACDFSKRAVEVMRTSENYDEKHMVADVWDVTQQGDNSLPPGLAHESVDVVVLIFIFSALAPDEWDRALQNVYRVLKPGGEVLFRDYGRGDLAQVRFRKGRYLGENFYIRGDGTRVYFFEKEELEEIWAKWTPQGGVPLRETHYLATTQTESQEEEQSQLEDQKRPETGVFEVLKVGVDRRLLVNRQQKLKMYRCWLQGRFRKRTVDEISDLEVKGASRTQAEAVPTS